MLKRYRSLGVFSKLSIYSGSLKPAEISQKLRALIAISPESRNKVEISHQFINREGNNERKIYKNKPEKTRKDEENIRFIYCLICSVFVFL